MLIDVSLMSIFSTGRTLSLSPLMIVLFFVLSLSLARSRSLSLSLSLDLFGRDFAFLVQYICLICSLYSRKKTRTHTYDNVQMVVVDTLENIFEGTREEKTETVSVVDSCTDIVYVYVDRYVYICIYFLLLDRMTSSLVILLSN